MTTTHTIFGAGQVGTQLASLLAEQGLDVRLVRRSPPGPTIPGVTWLQGDARDAAFADAACRDAATVYNCTNPTDYAKWAGVLLPVNRAILSAASRAGARFVQLDNLYMYGKPATSPFNERTPMEPCSDHGRLRKQWVDEMFAAHERGEVQVTSGRASDYFGPDTPNAAVIRPDVLKTIARGGSVFVFGNPDMLHSYTYTPDVARGLAVLGTHEQALGRAWHLPTSAQLTTRELVDRFAVRAGTLVKTRQVPSWALKAAGLFSGLMGALAEMNYQWEVPYLIDDGDFRRTFGIGPTPLDEAIATTLTAREAASVAA